MEVLVFREEKEKEAKEAKEARKATGQVHNSTLFSFHFWCLHSILIQPDLHCPALAKEETKEDTKGEVTGNFLPLLLPFWTFQLLFI